MIFLGTDVLLAGEAAGDVSLDLGEAMSTELYWSGCMSKLLGDLGYCCTGDI